jgi:hypothetical protein
MPIATTPTVASHFTGKDPSVRAAYDRLLKAARVLGEVVEDPKKTSIHLVRKTAFAGVQVHRAHLVLTLKSDHDIDSPRVHRSEQTSKTRFHHELRLASVRDVDAQLERWLSEAYALSG